MLTSNYAVSIAAVGLVGVSLISVAGRNLEDKIFDNETPLTQTLTAAPKQLIMHPGESVDIHYDYKKRKGCVGTVEYRMDGTPDGWNHSNSFVVGSYKAGWPDGDGKAAARLTLPADFPPGDYQFTMFMRAERCDAAGETKASSKPIDNRSIPVEVKVIPKSGL